jgi:crotonobetainyl-CoA:carnitine CoA-transferase CaiB-like acyl-CoA transferase
MKQTNTLPLSGISVLEFGHTVMGPTCGMILADMGAEVIKIEKAPQGDDTRRLKGFGAGFFVYLNRNKKSLAVDLKSPEGLEVIKRLVKYADVLVENFGPGTIDRLGLGYETCSGLNPKLIYCALKGFMPGPYEKRPALDEVVQMMAGLAYMTGPSGRPLRAGASVTDIMGGCFGVIGILAALHQRSLTGKGTIVRASLFESVAFLVGQHMAVAAVTGQAPPPMPERGRTWSIYDLFETRDGEQVFLGVTSGRHWQRMCEVFGFTDWADDKRLSTNQSRIESRDWFLPKLAKRLGAFSKDELMNLALKAQVPVAAVARPQDLLEDEHLNASEGLVTTTLPNGKQGKLPKIPLQMEGCDFGLRQDPPKVGQGGAEFLEKAGLTSEKIESLRKDGVLVTYVE